MLQKALLLRSILIAAYHPLVALGQNCYYPNGELSLDANGKLNDGPCSHDGASMCCPLNWACLANYMCRNLETRQLGRFTCTDKNWASDACPKFCDGSNPPGVNSTDSGNSGIERYGEGVFCCNGDNSGKCAYDEHPATIRLGDFPMSPITTITSVGFPTLSSTTQMSITSTLSTSTEVSVAITTNADGEVSTTTVKEYIPLTDCTTILHKGATVCRFNGSHDEKESPPSKKPTLAIALSLGIAVPLLLGATILLCLRSRRRRRNQMCIQSNTYNADQRSQSHRSHSTSARARSLVMHFFSSEKSSKSSSTDPSEAYGASHFMDGANGGGEKPSNVPELDGFPRAAGGSIISTPNMNTSPDTSAHPTINSTMLRFGLDGSGTCGSGVESRSSMNDTTWGRGLGSADGGYCHPTGCDWSCRSRHARVASEKDGVALPVELEAREARKPVTSTKERVGEMGSSAGRGGGQEHDRKRDTSSSPKDHQTWASGAFERELAVGGADGLGRIAGDTTDTEEPH
ncbi:hypothetical protein IWX92DRAFT_383442 [Phyllosticta citricarpa]